MITALQRRNWMTDDDYARLFFYYTFVLEYEMRVPIDEYDDWCHRIIEQTHKFKHMA